MNKTSAPKTQGSLQKRRQKYFNSQRFGEFAVRVYLLGMSEAEPTEYYQHDCLKMSRRTATLDTLRYLGKSMNPQSNTKNHEQLRNAECGIYTYLGERNTIGNTISTSQSRKHTYANRVGCICIFRMHIF